MAKGRGLALAYDIACRNSKPKKMKDGGEVEGGFFDSVAKKAKDAAKAIEDYHNAPIPQEKNKEPAKVKNFGPIYTGFAEGGEVMKPKIQKIKHPSMAQSPVFKVKMRDQEDDMIESMQPQKHEGMSEDKGPAEEEFMADHFAHGGKVPDEAITEEISYKDRSDRGYGKIIFKAEGGEIEENENDMGRDEQEESDEDSLVAAIMSKRAKMMAEGGEVEHEGDEMLKEGEVDLDDNGREIPNAYYHANEDEVLEHNFDHDIMEKDQPMDSNQMGDAREDAESDPHDMVSKIRSQMNKRRQFKAR
jgi:hypothetical protein